MRTNKKSKKASRMKKNNTGWVFVVIGAFIGTAVAVLLLLLTAVIIKNFSPNDGVLSIISTLIKILGSYFAVSYAVKRVSLLPVILGIVVSAIYMVISSVLFITLSKSTVDFRTFGVDMAMSVVSGVLFSIILGKKSLFVKNK